MTSSLQCSDYRRRRRPLHGILVEAMISAVPQAPVASSRDNMCSVALSKLGVRETVCSVSETPSCRGFVLSVVWSVVNAVQTGQTSALEFTDTCDHICSIESSSLPRSISESFEKNRERDQYCCISNGACWWQLMLQLMQSEATKILVSRDSVERMPSHLSVLSSQLKGGLCISASSTADA